MHLPFASQDQAMDHLRAVGEQDDAMIDVGISALALGLQLHPGLSVERYFRHLDTLTEQTRELHAQHIEQEGEDTARLRADCLIQVLHAQNDYDGDHNNYDDLQNADLISVIDRRKGLPVAIGILYLCITHRLGWLAAGLSFPAHFLLHLDKDSDRLILDPFNKGKEMSAADLRALIKSILGDNAELSHNFYEPVSARETLVRLQNNLKKRLIETEDYTTAARIVETMIAFAPIEYRSFFDLGILYAKIGHIKQARQALQDYIDRTPNALDKAQATEILNHLSE